MAATSDIPPNQTLYVQRLNEKIKKDDMKKSLYELFSQHGQILEVYVKKTLKMRGQAWIVYNDIASATKAIRELQGFPLFDKPMEVHFAKVKSDVIAKADGSFVPREKRKADNAPEPVANKRAAPARTEAPANPAQEMLPHNVLFVQNLPDACTKEMLEHLFQQFNGCVDCRLVPGRPGIAFIDFKDEMLATVAMNGLQGFQVDTGYAMTITYAKR
eukprot:GFYU01010283.1.p2 GENE.GFYU01010283.1~~GFYU01010283.1.p2  ORF type:complete len:216 (+),score=60.45 GFYU01010283.1:117-764(+)